MKKIQKPKKGFTLAEIIISMTIIGVIAAITIPALLVSTNEKTMEAQKRALQARMSQAVSQIEDLRVYETSPESSTLNFITKALSETYRITKTCDKNGLTNNCNFPSEITTQNGGVFNINDNSTLSSFVGNPSISFGVDTDVAGFKTSNGESIAIFYNPRCRGSKTNGFYSGLATTAMCLNMIFDLNGSEEAPNEVGKDIGFISVFFPKDADVVLPITYSADTDGSFNSYQDAINLCKEENKSLVIPNWEEGMSMGINKKLLANIADSAYLVSGAGSTSAYKVNIGNLTPETTDDFSTMKLRCIYNK